jgi:erythromycin esterase-like protein
MFASSRRAEMIPAEMLHPVESGADYDALVEKAGKARFVLIGEASHGTQEFYATRAELTQRLIQEKGFRMVALEADWPDALRVHRYVIGQSDETDASAALADFRRFPSWMWRNTVMRDFVAWLRDWNLRQNRSERTGIFGMDLYSLHASMEAVLVYLEKTDPQAAARARRRYQCFESFGEDPQAYGYATTHGAESCEGEVVSQLAELRRDYGEMIRRDGRLAEDEFFYAEQNARLVANAEHYYRSMFRGRDQSWNLRDKHMTETLEALTLHFKGAGGGRIVVWAHNSHLGDASATEMSARGEWNVGQLMRERFGAEVFNIGFSTSHGTVTAAQDWGDPAQRRWVRNALPESYEHLFHRVDVPNFWLDLRAPSARQSILKERRLQRAIGVIYRPETERWSHYFHAHLLQQFDAIIHLDKTHALKPLESSSEWDAGELPETYPEGF